MAEDATKEKRTWVEHIEVAGDQLIARIKKLIEKGNVRRLIIRNSEGHILLEIPLSAGLAVGGVTTIVAPVLVALGAMAALIASFKVEVVRNTEKSKTQDQTLKEE